MLAYITNNKIDLYERNLNMYLKFVIRRKSTFFYCILFYFLNYIGAILYKKV